MMFDISQNENKSQNPDGSNNLNIQKPQTRASRHFENNSVINYNKDMNQELDFYSKSQMTETKQKGPLKNLISKSTRFSLSSRQKNSVNEKETSSQINHFFDHVFNKNDKRLRGILQLELKVLEKGLEKQRKIDAEEGCK